MTLARVLGENEDEMLLASLAVSCSGVIVCRASPAQKAAIVGMMKRYHAMKEVGPQPSAADLCSRPEKVDQCEHACSAKSLCSVRMGLSFEIIRNLPIRVFAEVARSDLVAGWRRACGIRKVPTPTCGQAVLGPDREARRKLDENAGDRRRGQRRRDDPGGPHWCWGYGPRGTAGNQQLRLCHLAVQVSQHPLVRRPVSNACLSF